MIKQCFIYLLSLILGSVLVYSLTALAIAPINPEVGSNPVLEAIISKLAYCESRNNPNAGILQFKLGTFRGYWKELINKDAEEQDIQNLWKDPEAQKQLAESMLQKDMSNLHHWTNCSLSLGLI
jgi:hypothetical protein